MKEGAWEFLKGQYLIRCRDRSFSSLSVRRGQLSSSVIRYQLSVTSYQSLSLDISAALRLTDN